MCGIFGYVTNGRSMNDPDILEALARRGPDASGRIDWTFPDAGGERACVLLHTRLAIIDLSEAANQPMTSACGTVSLVYNGELYNACELRSALEARGHVFSTRCDTEVLLESYREWGPRCLLRLRGMFAFAVLDRKRHSLFLARDHFGMKPLYYSGSGDDFCFSSSVSGILASGFRRSWRLSEQALAWYRAIGSALPPDTIVDGISALEPGSALTWKDGQITHERWFDLGEFALSQAQTSADDARAATRHALQDSVSRHLVADVPLGVFLSGGIDSTAVASLAARTHGRMLHTMSVAVEGHDSKSSDASIAARTANDLGTSHQTLRVSYADFEDAFADFVSAIDVPSRDGLNTYLVARAAKEHCTVVLSGLGGDELFAGYPVFRDIYWGSRLPRLGRMARSWPAGITHRLGIGWAHSVDRDSVDVMLGKRIVGPTSAAMRHQLEGLVPGGVSALTQATVFEARQYMANTLLRDTDAVTMYQSMEARLPFVDLEVLRAALSVPDDAKVGWRHNKPALLAALADVMPRRYIAAAKKKGFDLPLDHWVQCYSAQHAEEVAEAARTLQRFGIEWSEDAPGRGGQSVPRLEYPALVLAQWLSLHSRSLEA